MGGIDLALSEQSMQDDLYPIKVQKLIELNLEGLEESDEDSTPKDDKKSSLKTGVNNSIKKPRKRDDPADAGMSKLKYDLKAATKAQTPKVPSSKDLFESEDDFDIDSYRDEQIYMNASINKTLKSTLRRFDDTYNDSQNKSILISENNSSGDDNET